MEHFRHRWEDNIKIDIDRNIPERMDDTELLQVGPSGGLFFQTAVQFLRPLSLYVLNLFALHRLEQ